VPARARACLVVVAVALAGCGGGSDRRDAVDRYVREANTVQNGLRRPLIDVAHATREFGTRASDLEKERPRLVKATRTFAVLQRRLERLEPPPDARRLHRLLLRLVSTERSLTDELRRVVVVVPELDAASRPVASAGKRLQAELDGAKTGPTQAAALDRYGAALAAPLRTLRAVDPPPLLEPLRASQIETLVRLRRNGAQLASALRQRREADVAPLVARFQAAARTPETLAAQRARIAAIKAYNARVKAVATLAAAVQRERDRLDRELD
jgi:hypothetical protein